MDYYETNQGARVRLMLTDEELGLDAIDDLCNKYLEFLSVTKESGSGRKTRSAMRRGDQIFDEIMAYKLPPIKLKQLSDSPPLANSNRNQEINNHQKAHSTNSSIDSSESSNSRPIARSLRPRCRTPEVQSKRQPSPATPANQRIRAHGGGGGGGGGSNNGSCSKMGNVLSAALNQQHPSVSVTKIRQLLRADSAQKKRMLDDEEKERQERLRLDRKAKEERAEMQKKLLLEERAVTAKLRREQRLLHAAEVRKAREEAKQHRPTREETKKPPPVNTAQQREPTPEVPTKSNQKTEQAQPTTSKARNKAQAKEQPTVEPQKLNETFQKPEINNIEIVITDDSCAENEETKVVQVAHWSKPPHFREALIKQFSKQNFSDYLKKFKETAPPLALPVDLQEILGTKSVGTRYLVRTSSAVWSPVHRPLKRASSMVMTPNNDDKR